MKEEKRSDKKFHRAIPFKKKISLLLLLFVFESSKDDNDVECNLVRDKD